LLARRSPLVLWAGAGVVAVSTALALRRFPLPQGPETTLCFVRRFTGFSCPGCGMTRAFAALARGEWHAAWGFHPLSFLVLTELAVAWALWGVSIRRGRAPLSRRAVNVALAANAALLLAVWVVRWALGTLPP
jgi:Protein of unknown function (DUF2752)